MAYRMPKLTSNCKSKLLTLPSAERSENSLTEPTTNKHGPLPTTHAIAAHFISAIYSGLTFCYWAPIQALTLSLARSLVIDIPSSLESEVIIMPTLHLRIPIDNPRGASFLLVVHCQSLASRPNYLIPGNSS